MTPSILSQARKQDEKLCRELVKFRPYGAEASHRFAVRAAVRIEALNQALMEASHDRDRFMADAERSKGVRADG